MESVLKKEEEWAFRKATALEMIIHVSIIPTRNIIRRVSKFKLKQMYLQMVMSRHLAERWNSNSPREVPWKTRQKPAFPRFTISSLFVGTSSVTSKDLLEVEQRILPKEELNISLIRRWRRGCPKELSVFQVYLHPPFSSISNNSPE